MDELAKGLYFSLVRDFRLLHGQDFAENAVKAFGRSVHEFRDYEWPRLGVIAPYRFKAWMQLRSFLKKYKFEDDRYTDTELVERTYSKYLGFQQQRSVYRPFNYRTILVLKEARRIIKGILNKPYDPASFFQIGKRACHRVPLSKAYFDNKWGEAKSFSCPTALSQDLHNLGKDMPIFKSILKKLHKKKRGENLLNLRADSLKLTLVPKSWKILRAITPLTPAGLLFSYGVGGFVESCLEGYGLPISKLQMRHQRLVKNFSRNEKYNKHATADLTSASDSLRSDLLNRLLPRFLYRDVRKTFTRQVLIDDVCYMTESVLPMGNAATFPIETLCFYGLIKAIGNLLKVKGVYSVYGDDLIYPSSIHAYVRDVFRDLGIGINDDKTFVDSYFRESCGSDYYRGCDVRPAFLPVKPSTSGRLHIVQWLYKTANALLRRWDESELPHTMRLIRSNICYLSQQILYVPPSFPDDAGWRIETPPSDWIYPKAAIRSGFKDGQSTFIFKYLGRDRNKPRVIKHESVYLLNWFLDAQRRPVVTGPPIQTPTWGRYCGAGMTSLVARWFLKSPMPDGVYSLVKTEDATSTNVVRVDLVEPVHESGRLKVSLGSVQTWT